MWEEPKEADRYLNMKGLVDQGKELEFYPESNKKPSNGFKHIGDVTWFTF